MKKNISFISIVFFLTLLLIISYLDGYNFIPSLEVFATKTDSSSTSTDNPTDKSSTENTGTSDSSGVALLARVINAEARGEPYLGQVAVGAVIMNRVKSPEFPDTISGVIYQKGQFTSVTDGQFDQDFEKDTTVHKAAEEAYNGSDPTNGAIFFYNAKTTKSQWLFTRTTTKVIGSHTFAK